MARVEVSRIRGGGHIKTIVMLDKIVKDLNFRWSLTTLPIPIL